MATQSLGLYDAKFAPYPYQSISIVETDVPDGQEYDGLVFLATNFYNQYTARPKATWSRSALTRSHISGGLGW